MAVRCCRAVTLLVQGKNMMKSIMQLAPLLLTLGLSSAHGQPMTLGEVQGGGAKALSAVEVRELVIGAKTEFTLVNGTTRIWTNASDGTLIASRTAATAKRSARGTWSVNADAAYCLTFDWGQMDTEAWCRQLYRVEDRYYAFAPNAKPETRSGTYRFSR